MYAKTTGRRWQKRTTITLSIYLVLSERERTCFYICWYCSQYYTALNGNFKVEDRMRGFTGLATVMVYEQLSLGEIYSAYRGIASMFSFTHS